MVTGPNSRRRGAILLWPIVPAFVRVVLRRLAKAFSTRLDCLPRESVVT